MQKQKHTIQHHIKVNHTKSKKTNQITPKQTKANQSKTLHKKRTAF
jgi:hypothetical protein